ncbi:sensor histidine kinase [Streptomyces turgidiscabies]|uniref:histidine kinase n=1 Tax=Streptomyces turgidiscabies (strain Car8) TaxID=698760 RepID=L7F7A2_STRT8|nr:MULTISPECIES: sensor histidine kinase [Streptomyces]ELP66984.1 histidine kinase [Streptomyces turgidiscabies Car8]MDX3493150.1 sensor histidine kinase [Streptomyces turgidiscabies]GAQ70447.1 sensor histidine kinase LiaS [Streptomyces turgidiscabies]
MRIHPLVVDTLIVAALTGVALLLGPEAARQGQNPLDATAYVLVVLVHLPLVLRGRAPLVICCLVHATWLVYITAGYWPVVCSFGPMLAVYTVASVKAVRVSVPCAALMGGVWIYAGAVNHTDSWESVAAQAVVYPAMLWRFGLLARRSTELTRQLRREQAARARREVAEERGRIARELHDVVAHHLSVISVQTGLARFVFDTDRPTTRTALDTIEATGKEALDELRRMLLVLRAADDRAPVGPMPGLARLGEMAERVRAGGTPVALTVEGVERPLAPGVDLCAYRVVQEALTNVLKHAPGASAWIRLRYEPHQVTVSVTDDGEGVIPARVRTGGGHGLLGMRERAKLYGGQIDIGPRDQGGFAVRLTLPTSTRAAQQGDDATT